MKFYIVVTVNECIEAKSFKTLDEAKRHRDQLIEEITNYGYEIDWQSCLPFTDDDVDDLEYVLACDENGDEPDYEIQILEQEV